MCHFRAQKGPFVMNKVFLVQTIIITFIYLLGLFIVQNLKKFLQRIHSYEDAQFLGLKWSICLEQIFFWKLISFSSISHFHCAKFLKNSSSGSRVMRMRNFWPQNGPFPKNENFFQKTC